MATISTLRLAGNESLQPPVGVRLFCVLQAVTSLVFTQHSGGLLLSGGEDTVVSTWLLMDVLDASLSQQAMQQQPPPPLYSWYPITQAPSCTDAPTGLSPLSFFCFAHYDRLQQLQQERHVPLFIGPSVIGCETNTVRTLRMLYLYAASSGARHK